MQDLEVSLYLTCPSLTNLLSFLLSFGFDDAFHDSALDKIDKVLNPDVALA